MKIFTLLAIAFVSCAPFAAINLDGVLDETEWSSAQHFSHMKVVEPYVLTDPEFATEILVTSDQSGIYFGIKSMQPVETRNNDISARDQRIGSDKVQLIIDFDSNAITAYSFEIGIGGSIRDGIYSNENNFSNEWDGNWSAQTASTDEYWIAEVLIPWDVVSMKQSDNGNRTINWYVSRTVADQNQLYANVPVNSSRQRFMSDFSGITIKDFAASSFQLFAYATSRKDFHAQKNSFDAGFDLFWKSGNGKQLTASVNADFGQIESDRLVVNFSATEVFFNERRPFFTENQSLFDVQGANGLRLVHTRRIGASPDTGEANESDIDVAVKFTDNRDQLTYGFLAAFEAEGDGFEGRDFFASRFLHKTERQTLGFTGTYVDRTDIDRTAMSYTFDHEYLFGDSFKIKSQLIGADSEQFVDGDSLKDNDWALWTQMQQQISENQQHSLEISHYGRDFEINDFGFLPRNNLNSITYEHILRQTDFSESSHLQQREYNFNVEYQSNDNGVTLDTVYSFTDSREFKDSSSFSWDVNFTTSGINDLISRDNGLLKTDSGHSFRINYRSSNVNKFRYHGFIRHNKFFSSGDEIFTHIHPSYFFKDNYNVALSIFYTDSKDWLNWIENDIFGRYERKLVNTSLDFNANFSQKQELRFRFQWLAIDAHARNQYQLNSSGGLNNTGVDIDDFSLSNTALQIRYRYEIAPLSNIFIVYSRGGSVFADSHEGLNSLFNPGFSNVDSDNFLIKFRYKFF